MTGFQLNTCTLRRLRDWSSALLGLARLSARTMLDRGSSHWPFEAPVPMVGNSGSVGLYSARAALRLPDFQIRLAAYSRSGRFV